MGVNITKMTTDVNNIQALSDLPNQTDGLTAQGLKERFDKAGSDIKTFLNTSLIPELEELMNAIYPIGRGFIDFTETDYSNYLGFTWERELVGMTPVGLDISDSDFNSVGKTGGEKSHTLINDEIPNVKGSFQARQANGVNVLDVYDGGGCFTYKNNGGQRWALQISGSKSSTNSNSLITFDNGGKDQAHNNLQPYQVVSYWKRVS